MLNYKNHLDDDDFEQVVEKKVSKIKKYNWKPLSEIPKELIYKPLLFRAYYFEECFYQEFIYSRYSENPFRLHGITGKPLKTIGVDDCDIFDDETYDFSKIEYLDISILNN